MLTPEMRTLMKKKQINRHEHRTNPQFPQGHHSSAYPNEIAFLILGRPKRLNNVKANPNVELNYVDVFRRKACDLLEPPII